MEGLTPEPEPEPESVRPPVRPALTPAEQVAPSAVQPADYKPVVKAPVVDDYDEPVDEPAPPTSGVSKSLQKRTAWILIGVVAVLVVGVFGVIGHKTFGASDEGAAPSLDAQLDATSAAEAPSQPTSPPAAPAAKFSCVEKSSGGEVTGAGPGDRASVPGVVLAFNDAYYQARDAKKALALMAPESPLKDADAMQKAIDEMPAGTKHCVTVRADGDTASVELTEARPNTAPAEIGQKFTTTRDGDTVSIVDVTEG